MLRCAHMIAGPVAQQQGAADGCLKLADLLAHRRLGPVDAFAGARKAAFIDHANQGVQQLEI